MALTTKQINDLNNAMEANQRCELGTLIASLEANTAAFLVQPAYVSAAINGAKTIVTLTYDSALYSVGDATALKAGITWAAGGVTFIALGGSDTVAISGFTIVITFNSALTLATNKIHVAADTVKNVLGKQNIAVTTAAISAL